MKLPLTIFLVLQLLCALSERAKAQTTVDFFGVSISLPVTYNTPAFTKSLTADAVKDYITSMDSVSLQPYLAALIQYREEYRPDDWLYYQLVRKVSQLIAPKKENYFRYTFYKWWFLTHSGFDAKLTIADTILLFYVQSNENIYNIPARTMEGKQYVCLNYHDYGSIDFDKHQFADVTPLVPLPLHAFSYKINHLPDFRNTDYTEREVAFSDGNRDYSFLIKINPQVKQLFTNYPVVDYGLQFNMPLSKTTYESLVPSLKKFLKGLKPREGVEFLTQFTRYAFSFKSDKEAFGGEKRLTPEQTLLYDYSDCEDRAALFFFLVKEIYHLPMLVLTYPQHVTVAVQFDKAFGKFVEYNGMKYTICEPSPQRVDLRIGQVLPELAKADYQVAFAYRPLDR